MQTEQQEEKNTYKIKSSTTFAPSLSKIFACQILSIISTYKKWKKFGNNSTIWQEYLGVVPAIPPTRHHKLHDLMCDQPQRQKAS